MWISIIGCDGVGKNIIAKHLKEKLKFTLLEINSDHEIPQHDLCEREFFYLNERARLHIDAKKRDEDVVMVRSVFDTFEVFAELSYRMEHITEVERNYILYNKFAFSETIPVPEAVIYVTNSKMNQLIRLKERGAQYISDDYMKWQKELYEKFMQDISVPVIEIDAERTIESFYGEIDFSINSLKTSNLSTRTIWKRTFLR